MSQRAVPGPHLGAPVVVDGWHPLGEEVAAQLRRCRVPVRAGAHAALAAELDLAAGTVPAAVVLVVDGRVPTSAGVPWHGLGVPHLPVAVGAASVVVGPLVDPGNSACLACAGAAWPAAAERPAVGGAADGARVLAAAVTTVSVLSALRGDRSLAGVSTEIGLFDHAVVHRLWKVRDDCRCASVRMAG